MLNPSFATFWGGFRRGVRITQNKGEMVDFKLHGFKKELPVYLKHNNQKKDLVIFFPGVFGKPNGRISPHVIEEIETRDVHVAVLPNLLAPTYLSAKPTTLGDPISQESDNQRKVVNEILKRIDFKYIKKVHIVAESLGCLQALSALNNPGTQSKITSLTLLWPPLFLNRSIKRFDDLIARSLSMQEACSFWWKWPQIIYRTNGQELPNGINDEDKKCFGAWVIGSGFVGSIKETAKDVAKFSNDQLPNTFTGFIAKVIPEIMGALNVGDERLSTEFLLRPYLNTPIKIRLASSSDDFLNDPVEWKKFKEQRPELNSKIYLFSWGGHSGPIGMENFMAKVVEEILLDK